MMAISSMETVWGEYSIPGSSRSFRHSRTVAQGDKWWRISENVSFDNRAESRRSGRTPERLMVGVGANNPLKLGRIAGPARATSFVAQKPSS